MRPLTTLAKVQFASAALVSDQDGYLRRVQEALLTVEEAIAVGRRQRWREVHPYDVGIRGLFEYLSFLRRRRVYTLDRGIRAKLKVLLTDAERLYGKEDFAQLRARYDELIVAFK